MSIPTDPQTGQVEEGAIVGTPTGPQTGQAEGERRRDEMTGIVRHRRPFLVRAVQRALVSRLMEYQEATTDDIRTCVDPPAAAGTSFWGAGANGLAQAKIIRRVEFRVSSRPERHGCFIGVWTLAVDHEKARQWLAAHPALPDPDEGDESAPGAMAAILPKPPMLPALAVSALQTTIL
jgi:hypothetical protein